MSHAFSFFGISLALSGCLLTRQDIAEEEHKRTVQQQVASLQQAQADSRALYGELNEELRSIHGRVERLESRVSSANRDLDKSNEQTSQQVAEGNRKFQLLQETVQKLETQMNFLQQEVIKISQIQSSGGNGPSHGGGKSEKKIDSFKLAEAAFQKKDWKNAILHYESYRKGNPKGTRFGSATLRIGICFKELGLRDDAETFFEEVIVSFPGSTLAQQAKDLRKKGK